MHSIDRQIGRGWFQLLRTGGQSIRTPSRFCTHTTILKITKNFIFSPFDVVIRDFEEIGIRSMYVCAPKECTKKFQRISPLELLKLFIVHNCEYYHSYCRNYYTYKYIFHSLFVSFTAIVRCYIVVFSVYFFCVFCYTISPRIASYFSVWMRICMFYVIRTLHLLQRILLIAYASFRPL